MFIGIRSFFRRLCSEVKAEFYEVKLWQIIVGSVTTLLLGFIIGVTTGNKELYSMLKLPSFAPPSFIFPIIWTVAYLMIGAAVTFVITTSGKRNEILRYRGLLLFVIGTVLNLLWYPIFFGGGYYLIACTDLLALLLLSIKTTVIFGNIKISALIPMIFYCIMLIYALIINVGIVLLN